MAQPLNLMSSYFNLLVLARYFKISAFILDPSQNHGVVKYIGLDGNSDGTISGTKYKNNQARLDISFLVLAEFVNTII